MLKRCRRGSWCPRRMGEKKMARLVHRARPNVLAPAVAAAALAFAGAATHAQPGVDDPSGATPPEPALEGLAPLSEVLLLQTPPVSVALSQALSVADESPRFAEPFAVDVTPATYGRWETTSSGRTAVWRH